MERERKRGIKPEKLNGLQTNASVIGCKTASEFGRPWGWTDVVFLREILKESACTHIASLGSSM